MGVSQHSASKFSATACFHKAEAAVYVKRLDRYVSFCGPMFVLAVTLSQTDFRSMFSLFVK